MPTPPTAIIQLLSVFGVAFSVRSFAKAQVLVFGAILAPGPRTVTATLRAWAGDARGALATITGS